MAAVLRIKPVGGLAAAGAAPAAPGDELKRYTERLVKLVPAEAVTLYLTGQGLIPADVPIALAIWTAFCFIFVIIARAFATSDRASGVSPEVAAVVIAAISFLIWVYSMGGPFAAYGLAVPWLGALLVLGWTALVPLVYTP